MDYILTHDWLFYPLIAYLSLCLLKWQYVARGMPYMISVIREERPEWPRALFWVLRVWVPIFLLLLSPLATPLSLLRERSDFFRLYPESDLYALAKEIIADNS